MSRWPHALIAVASLAGAAGVAEAAAAAHHVAGSELGISANFLMLNAAASIAITAFARAGTRELISYLIAATILLAGSILFCADISLRVFAGQRLFHFAAPIGGTLMIIGWLAGAVTAIGYSLRQRPEG